MSLAGVLTLNFLRVGNMCGRNGDGFQRKMPLGEVSSYSLLPTTPNPDVSQNADFFTLPSDP